MSETKCFCISVVEATNLDSTTPERLRSIETELTIRELAGSKVRAM
jgi:hypothetical protein